MKLGTTRLLRTAEAGIVASVAACALLASGAAARAADTPAACPAGNAGLRLPPGFCATIFADGIGHARQMAVAPDGTLYVNTWSGRYYHDDKPHAGGFVVALKDTKGAGKADTIERFGMSPANGGHGGTGVGLHGGYVYAEEGDHIDRYKLASGAMVPDAKVETVVTGMPMGGDHPMHPFIIDPKGQLFVDMGSATNACQDQNRMPHSPGIVPCREKDVRGGTWLFSADKTGQSYSPENRYASGIRNGEGFAFDTAGRLFVTQHGRDQLWQNWPNLYKPAQEAELPAEELMLLRKGADYGWPECYFDGLQGKLVLAPEYGGDGGRKVGVCAEKTAPAAFFPAHLAPNGLAIDTASSMFPKSYKDAAFIAFHGSWNRAPAPQEGYFVVVQPMADGKPSGKWVVFADGFAGGKKDPGAAKHRPSGVAFAPDGSLFISDDVAGTIYRVTYNGPANAPVAGIQEPSGGPTIAADAQPPEGLHPDAGAIAALPIPAGASEQEVALGSQIFHGEAKQGTCTGCHGANGEGGSQGPNLTDTKWLWSDGSLDGIRKTIAAGVAKPKQYNQPMPPRGGADLTDQDVKAVAAYVWAISHKGQAPAH